VRARLQHAATGGEHSARRNDFSFAGFSHHLQHFQQRRNTAMNWDRIEGNWKQLKGKVKQKWGKLTDDQLDVIAGNRDQLSGVIQEQYGLSKDEVERQLREWQDNIDETATRH